MELIMNRPDEVIDKGISKELLLTNLKEHYMNEIEKSTDSSDYNFFFWAKNPVTIYIIADSVSGLCFSTQQHNQEKDSIKLIDLRKESDNLEYKNIYSFDQRLSYFINKGLFKLSTQEKIIKPSKIMNTIYLISFIDSWCSNEYKIANKNLTVPAIKLPYHNENTIHQSKFEFREMLTNIDDEQFKAEFNEFLFGYNHECFFLSASALGSIMEHLMFLILDNYGETKLLGTRHPTAKKYLSAFEQSKYIRFNDRDSSYFDNVFQTRNSFSHFNTGYALKSQCDMMLLGLTSLYKRFYLPSKVYQAKKK